MLAAFYFSVPKQVFKTPGSCFGLGCSPPPPCQTHFRTAAPSAPCPPSSFYLSVRCLCTEISLSARSSSSSSCSSLRDRTAAAAAAAWLEHRRRGPQHSTCAVWGNPQRSESGCITPACWGRVLSEPNTAGRSPGVLQGNFL